MKNIVLLFTLLILINSIYALDESDISYLEGEDYTFLYDVNPSNFSGFVAYTVDYPETYNQRTAWMLWKDLEPERGVYNWTVLETAIQNADNAGQGIQLWILSLTCGNNLHPDGIIVPCSVPDWIFEEYNISNETLPGMGGNFDVMVIPGWWPEIRNDFNAMVRALGEVYGDDPRIKSVYLQGISHSRGEEFYIDRVAIAELERDWNLTPQVMEDWIKSRMDAFADAFTNRKNIIAWVGKTEVWHYNNMPEYVTVAENLLEYSWSKGMGNRGGIVENYYTGMNNYEEAFGLIFDAQGYITVNESIPPIANNYYFGEENEEYNNESGLWIDRYCGGDAYECSRVDPHRYKMAIMRSLMNRFNHLWMYARDYMHNINPELREYARLSLGKNITNSPDAFAFLFEHPTKGFQTPANKYKNFERWLYQRDFPGGITVPDEPFYLPFDAGGNYQASENWFDYTVLRTDFESGNNSIYFYLDPNFQISGDTQIKIELLDNSETSWHLEYLDKSGNNSLSPSINNSNDGLVKTFTFDFSNNISFTKNLEYETDFKIVNEGPGNVAVRFVRVLRNLDESPVLNPYELDGLTGINIGDLYEFASQYFGTSNERADFNNDSKINILDAIILVNNFD